MINWLSKLLIISALKQITLLNMVSNISFLGILILIEDEKGAKSLVRMNQKGQWQQPCHNSKNFQNISTPLMATKGWLKRPPLV